MVHASESPELVYSGSNSLHVAGGGRCFLFRPIAPSCTAARVSEPVNAGDLLRISLKVRISQPNQIFQLYTGHYHLGKGSRRWTLPVDDSHMISRTLVPNANEWVTVTATHLVGDDWKFNGEVLMPESCNHYHLRFRVHSSDADFWVDDVSVSKVYSGGATNSTNSTDSTNTTTMTSSPAEISVPTSGFFANPSFDLEYQYWKFTPAPDHIVRDARLRRNAMVLGPGSYLRQNILPRSVPGQTYQFGFNVKMTNVESIELVAVIRMRFLNNDPTNGPCPRAVCNLFRRPLRKVVESNGGAWQPVVSDKFDMFDPDYMSWDGTVDFIMFQLFARDLEAGAEYAVSDFEVLGEDYTAAPSLSLVPSHSPTNLYEEQIGYVVRFAGEVRTVIRQPFQVDNTGEILAMNGTADAPVEYELCEVDEVEGRKSGVSYTRVRLPAACFICLASLDRN